MNQQDFLALSNYAFNFEKQLMGKLYAELNLTADGIRVMQNIKVPTKLPRLAVGKGLKPYTGNFAPMDKQFVYSDREISVERAQRDIALDPEQYRQTYLTQADAAAMNAGSSNANKEAQIPFAAFMWNEFMKENAQEILQMFYHGKGKAAFSAYSSGTAYTVGSLITFSQTVNGFTETQYYKCITATSTGQSPATHPAKWEWAGNLAITKGIGSKLADAISTEGFNKIATTGALTIADAYAQFTSVFRLQNEIVQRQGVTMYCSQNSYQILLDSIEQNSTKNYELINGIAYLPKTDNKAIIKPVNWLAGSNRILCTPANNFVLGTDKLSDLNQLTTIKQHYSLETSLSFVIGTQIADLDVLTVNDQA